MKKISTLLFGLLGSLLLIISSAAHAEQKQQLGEWDVHYMVVSTPFLTPEVAASYGIVRSKFNALVNISVLDAVTGTAQRVSVSGTAKNLIGTTKTLTFKKVEEGDAIYYLAVLPFRDRENYRFSIDVQRGNTMQTLNFKQEMFVDS
ncbi:MULTISPECIES: DUF4426 domain-containing protein [Alteromonas]|jgi:hypothetical protein|uniref:DUF4426 domain-containing protein n=1 Tax=Alteromonas stellipolaris TaxID=233316 RepID=A0AAW7Z652_9ALTE|nr:MULTISPECIES: DUF4426 domain-containing protein [Alteromonas]AMJ91718.1 hypothetical protein AV940_15235 [Alteromonas sp. Mac2]ALM89442.1 hypothetical protein AOR13_390 [Alteromonas stellipolaris LMG 21856]AMJ75431.1 hypothetical protein AVL57_16545 [Alteromonas stellipolaris]AMJ87854.1 hypothetical protein AV939_15485 [Alteromonas sp. Mac1]MDO6578471.1 DUF4426 domain-containing protein [Alteromonas stellipolaris]